MTGLKKLNLIKKKNFKKCVLYVDIWDSVIVEYGSFDPLSQIFGMGKF